MKTIKDFLETFQKVMAATSFAEAGEFETARRMLPGNKNANKKVLLGIDSSASIEETIRYALNICHRLGAGLEVLHLVGDKREATRKLPGVFSQATERIQYHPLYSENSLEEKVADFVKDRRDILFVVLNPDQEKERQGTQFSRLLKKLKCPVVVPGPTIMAGRKMTRDSA